MSSPFAQFGKRLVNLVLRQSEFAKFLPTLDIPASPSPLESPVISILGKHPHNKLPIQGVKSKVRIAASR